MDKVQTVGIHCLNWITRNILVMKIFIHSSFSLLKLSLLIWFQFWKADLLYNIVINMMSCVIMGGIISAKESVVLQNCM